jgi:transmembrane sensor
MSDARPDAPPPVTCTTAIEEIAASWVRRRHFGEWREEDQAALETWVNASLAHEVAYLRLDAAWARTERLVALRASKNGNTANHGSKERLAFRVAAIFVLVAAVSAGGVAYYLRPSGTLYTTPVGGHRTLTLNDGSRIELNTDSVLRLDDSERSASLERGEAYFDINHDAVHPFSVRVANHRIVDVGTRFIVRNDTQKVRVTLMEGKARFETTGNQQLQHPTLLEPGDVAIATADMVSITKEPAKKLAKDASWRRGVLVFDNTTLADAATELNRYNEQKLVVADAAAARTRIDASIPINGVEALARIARDAIGLRVEMRGDEVILLRAEQPK